jgi:CheY-like chemotaxis protein
MTTGKPLILLAEDDANDVFFMRRALQKAAIEYPLQVVTDGQQAVDYLGNEGQFSDREKFPPPAIILLDLKMPFLDGFEVLSWIGSQSSLKNIPVVILTSSAEERDRRKAAELGAKAYFVKPPKPDTLKQMMQFVSEARTN